MIDLALKAGLPMISVKTDDTVNLEIVLADMVGQKVLQVDKLTTSVLYQKLLFWTSDDRLATVENHNLLKDKGKTLVFVNSKPGLLAYDAGWLWPTDKLMVSMLSEYSQTPKGLLRLLKGMSLKSASELLLLTSAKYGDLSQKSVRAMRMALGHSVQGLYPMDTDLPYYEPMPELQQWMSTNLPYFVGDKTSHKLVPRGLLFVGPPGTGKTLAARQIARELDCPLYRLETATTLTKYIGESEGRLAQALGLLDREAPCVVLFDEIEKIFSTDADTSVIQRMLSQLLWWLQEHRSKVFTVMTSNNLKEVPPELYRPGRIDKVFQVPLMDSQQATQFARRLLTDMLKPGKPSLKQVHSLQLIAQPDFAGWSHADVTALVIQEIKQKGWIAA